MKVEKTDLLSTETVDVSLPVTAQSPLFTHQFISISFCVFVLLFLCTH